MVMAMAFKDITIQVEGGGGGEVNGSPAQIIRHGPRETLIWPWMIRHQNAVAMFVANTGMRGIYPPECPLFLIFSGGGECLS
jgi:hypothetical protein